MSEWVLGWVKRARSSPFVSFLETALAPVWRRDALAISIIVGVFVPMFLAVRLNPGGTDDCAYFEYAAGMDAGAPHHRQRFILLGTTALAQAIFGYTSLAYYAVPFFYSLGLILATYFAARAFLGAALSLLAALMVLAVPILLQQGTWLLPDIPSVFWVVLGVAIFLRALNSDEQRLPLKRAIGSGVCFFLAVSAKESTAPVLIGLGFFPLALMSKRAFKILLLTGAATVALALVELVVMWAIFDDALYRLHAVRDGHVPQMEKFARIQADLPEHVTWGYLTTRFFEAMNEHRYLNGWRFIGLGYWDWLAVSVPFAIATAAAAKHRLLLGLFGFVFWSYLSLTFALSSFDPLIPMVRTRDRYFLVVLVWLPIIILTGWSCLWAWPFRRPAPAQWPRIRIASMAGASALYLVVCLGTADNYVDKAPSIANGHSPVNDFYQRAVAFTKAGGRVKRVVGPRSLRAAAFIWPQHPFEISWRSIDLETKKKLKARDLLITEAPPALQVPPGLLWQQVDEHKAFRYYYIDDQKRKRYAGSFGTVAATRATINKLSSAKLGLRLRLEADRVEPGPLRVVLNRHGKSETLETFDWEKDGEFYAVQETSKSFKTSKIESVSLEFDVEGPGRFTLKRTMIRVLDPRKK